MKVEVLGSCCGNCDRTMDMIAEVAQQKGATIDLVKVTDIKQIMGYGVMSTPGVVIDGKVVHAGGVPARAKIEQWLLGAAPEEAKAAAGACCSGKSACCG
jgi:small redox-active disulfide protein 2